MTNTFRMKKKTQFEDCRGRKGHLWGHRPLVVLQGGRSHGTNNRSHETHDRGDAGGFYPGSGRWEA